MLISATTAVTPMILGPTSCMKASAEVAIGVNEAVRSATGVVPTMTSTIAG